MQPKTTRKAKAILLGLAWMLTHLPLDQALYQRHSEILLYAGINQFLEIILVTYLMFLILESRAYMTASKVIQRPWKCPVCDGWGKRIFVPGMSPETKAQLAMCGSCNGKGVVWEVILEDKK